MGVLRFFFTDKFTRADVLVIVIAAVTHTAGSLSFLGMLAFVFGGFMLTGLGEMALKRRAAADLLDQADLVRKGEGEGM